MIEKDDFKIGYKAGKLNSIMVKFEKEVEFSYIHLAALVYEIELLHEKFIFGQEQEQRQQAEAREGNKRPENPLKEFMIVRNISNKE